MAKKWAGFLGVTVGLSVALTALGLPAAWLLGPLLVGTALGVRGTSLRLPRAPTIVAQSLLGTFLASTLSADVLHEVAGRWPLVLGSALAVVLASAALGALLMRWRVLPGSAAVWGLAPGAAPAMVVMAEAWGADARLVAFMQYLRVALVVATAAVVAAWLGARPVVPAAHAGGAGGLVPALLLTVSGILVALRTRLPAGALVVPLLGGGALAVAGFEVQVPAVLVAGAAATVGAGIGLSFTRESFLHAASLLPRMFAAMVGLMSVCALVAFVLSATLDLDFFTLWLATSPGGLDSIALIATATHVDVSLVVAVQTTRFALVMLLGPALARTVARTVAGTG